MLLLTLIKKHLVMIEIILVSFIVLVAIWFWIEYNNASIEYDPFTEEDYGLSNEEKRIFEKYKKELL